MKIFFSFKSLLNNNRYLKNFLTLFTGSVIGQLIVFISIPFLTRMFSKEVFGIYALYISTIILIKPLVSLNYNLAIVLPKRDKDAINILVLNVFITSLFSSILFLIVYLFRLKIVVILNLEDLSYFIYFVPLSVFFIATISSLDYWNIRLNKYKNVSIGSVSKSVTLSFSQLIIGFSNFKHIGLIPGAIIGQFINLILIYSITIKNILTLKKHISYKRMLLLAFKYKDLPIFDTISTFVNSLSNELPVLLFTKFYGLSIAGVYGLAIKVSKTPPGIVGQSISQVFFREASLIYNSNEDLYNFIKKTYKTLFITALTIFIPLFIASFFLDIIFGAKWSDTGVIVRLVIPWLFITYLNSPVSSLVDILNKQRVMLVYNLMFLITRFLAIYIGYKFFKSFLFSIALYSFVGVLFNVFLSIYYIQLSKKYAMFKNKIYS